MFAIYAIASLVPVLFLGFVLSGNYRRDGRDRALDQGAAQAAVIEQMAIAPVVGKHDLRSGLTAGERNGLLDATQLAIFSDSVVRLRVRSFEGRVVFSDDGTTTGALPTADAAFRTAAGGGTDVEIVPSATRDARVIRVMQPIVPNATGRATGVLEVYLPYAAIAAKVTRQLHAAYLRLALVLLGLYLILALISWSSTRRLRRHASHREYEARHDSLTGLPNRESFRLRAERAVARAEGPAGGGAIVLMDLNRFKEVNDNLGHHAGDELLQVVAHRLRAAVRTDDLVARLGGDEFGLVLPGITAPDRASELLRQIRDDLATELTLEDVTLGIEASFGVALYPEHGTDVETLLKRADAAMYQGKRGPTNVVVFDRAGDTPDHSTHSLTIHSELRHAIANDELVLHYQPKVDLARRTMCGVEALLRWNHPTRGLLSPPLFLPEAERSSLIQPLTEWVLRRALADRAQWQAAGARWPVAINVSARNLEAPGFPELVLGLLAETGTPVEQVILEVTETALAADTELVNHAVAVLAEHGVAISVDDFGMGSTSLSGLRVLPIRELKIDRAFVSGLEHSEQDRSIVRAIIELCHGLHCQVTAEGVETRAIADWLTEASCDVAQGYFFARPAPWQELIDVDDVMRENSASAPARTTTPEPR